MTEIDKLLQDSQPILLQVHPLVHQRTYALIIALYGAGLNFGAFMGLRTFAQQHTLWLQGRITGGKIVTKADAGDSFHNYGLAVDLAEDGNPANDKGIQWSWSKNADYLKIGQFAKQVGLEWGGLWAAFRDFPHVQLSGSYTLAEIKSLYLVGGQQKVWDAVTKYYETTQQ